MKTTPTCLDPSRSSSHGNAAVLTPAFGTIAPRRRDYGSLSFALLTLLAILGLAGRVAAQALVPDRLSFQGYMADANGVPLGSNAPVNLPVVFRIFTAPTGGTNTWSERQVVTFDKGYYSVLLGQGAAVAGEPSPLLSAMVLSTGGNELYVESTVTISGSDAKILPRMRMLPTPYAFLASRALSVDGAGIISGTIPDARLSANITSGPIADSRLSTNVAIYVNGRIPDNRLSANITSGPIADSRLSTNVAIYVNGRIPDSRLSTNVTSGLIADSRLSGNIPRRNAANTFTTNQTIVGNLTVTSNINLGSAGQFKVAVGEESLRIVRGQAKTTGTTEATTAWEVVRGSGWSVKKITLPTQTTPKSGFQGVIAAEITFDPPFADVPVVTVSNLGIGALPTSATSWRDVFFVARVEQVSRTNAIITTLHSENGWWNIVGPFTFIAVGQR
jgi:hypothetical protein